MAPLICVNMACIYKDIGLANARVFKFHIVFQKWHWCGTRRSLHQPILIIFGRNVADKVSGRWSQLRHDSRKIWPNGAEVGVCSHTFFSHAVKTIKHKISSSRWCAVSYFTRFDQSLLDFFNLVDLRFIGLCLMMLMRESLKIIWVGFAAELLRGGP